MITSLGRNVLVSVTILLLLGAAFASGIRLTTITASNHSDLHTFTTRLCDTTRQGTLHSVQMTPQQAREIQRLFDNLKNQLSTTDSLYETHRIFNDTIDALARYNLLPNDLNIHHLKRLVTRARPYQKIPRIRTNPHTSVHGTSNEGEMQNYFCSVAGNTSNTHVAKLAKQIAHRLYVIMDHYTGNALLVKVATALWVVFNEISKITQTMLTQNGTHYGVSMYFGNYHYYPYPDWLKPAEGWIFTDGINGKQNLTGSFWGQTIAGGWQPQDDWYMNYTWRGCLGFSGLIIYTGLDNAYFIGSALHVHIGTDRP